MKKNYFFIIYLIIFSFLNASSTNKIHHLGDKDYFLHKQHHKKLKNNNYKLKKCILKHLTKKNKRILKRYYINYIKYKKISFYSNIDNEIDNKINNEGKNILLNIINKNCKRIVRKYFYKKDPNVAAKKFSEEIEETLKEISKIP